jgi:hypothetical protein
MDTLICFVIDEGHSITQTFTHLSLYRTGVVLSESEQIPTQQAQSIGIQ